jgi:hypothetical protein
MVALSTLFEEEIVVISVEETSMLSLEAIVGGEAMARREAAIYSVFPTTASCSSPSLPGPNSFQRAHISLFPGPAPQQTCSQIARSEM